MSSLTISDVFASRNKQLEHSPSKIAIPSFLALPLELRREIYSYLLPHTNLNLQTYRGSRIVWEPGSIALLSVCHQLYNECAAVLYGENIFEIRVEQGGIFFQEFRRLKSIGLVQPRTPQFCEFFGDRVMKRMRWIVVSIRYLDAYIGESRHVCRVRDPIKVDML